MARTKIIVLDPATKSPQIECLNNISSQTSLKVSYHLPEFSGCDSILNLDLSDVAGLVILDGTSSVHDHKPWQSILSPWLRTAINKKIPILGICYGQLWIAHLFGGIVSNAGLNQSNLIGNRSVSFLNNGGLHFKPLVGELLVNHREYLSALPYNFATWAQSSVIKLEAIKHKSLPVWGIQSNPAATQAYAKKNNLPVLENEVFDYGTKIMRAFLNFCE